MRELNMLELSYVGGGLGPDDQTPPPNGPNGQPTERDARNPDGMLGELRDAFKDGLEDILNTGAMMLDSVLDALGGDSGRSKDYNNDVTCPASKDLVDGNCVTPQTSEPTPGK